MGIKFQRVSVALPLLALLCSGAAQASMATGSIDFAGMATLNVDSFNATSQLSVFSANGAFSGETWGTIQNVSASSKLPIPQFITFDGAKQGPISFDLTTVLPGFGASSQCFTNQIGNVCTPVGSPLTFVQGIYGVSIDLGLKGSAYLGTAATGSDPALVAFQIYVAGSTITAILDQLATDGSINESYSASLSASAPEPSSILLSASLAAALLFAARGRFKRS